MRRRSMKKVVEDARNMKRLLSLIIPTMMIGSLNHHELRDDVLALGLRHRKNSSEHFSGPFEIMTNTDH